MTSHGTAKRVKTRNALVLALALVAACALMQAGCGWFGGGEEKQEPKPTVEAPAPETCPLCGSVVDDTSVIQRRPVAVKVENDPEARPQSGLDKACVVYEEITEGGITRFMAIYLCRDADPVGPIRSARPDDIDLVFPYNALFCHCGGAPQTLAMIQSSGICDLDQFADYPAYWRWNARRAPHNLYAGTVQLRRDGDGVYPFEGEVPAAFDFMGSERIEKMAEERAAEIARAAQPDSKGEDYGPLITVASNVYVPYRDVCRVQYRYDESQARFLRFVDGIPHTDMTTGNQLTADTVVVQYVSVTSSGIRDVYGAESPHLGVIGGGRAQVFMMGQAIDGTWEKDSRKDRTRYLDYAGEEIEMKPGSVWVLIVPSDMQVTMD